MKVRIHVKRAREGRQWSQTYELDVDDPRTTILDILIKVRENVDGTLAMRYACRMGVCGACAVVINGIPRLACATKLSDLNADEIFVEPLRKNVIKDLVVE